MREEGQDEGAERARAARLSLMHDFDRISRASHDEIAFSLIISTATGKPLLERWSSIGG